jgi:hypothetical protein
MSASGDFAGALAAVPDNFVSLRRKWSRKSLVSVQQVSRLERQLAGEFYHGYAAVDGVDVDHTDRTRNGCDLVDQIFVGIGDENGGVVAPVIGRCDQLFDLVFGQIVDLLQKHFHFRRRGSAHDESDRLAVGPVFGLGFADFYEVGQGDCGQRVSLVRDQGKIARGRTRKAGGKKQTET